MYSELGVGKGSLNFPTLLLLEKQPLPAALPLSGSLEEGWGEGIDWIEGKAKLPLGRTRESPKHESSHGLLKTPTSLVIMGRFESSLR